MQQVGLPFDGVRHVLELFMKSSSFTRYLLDDVLPKEIFNNRKVIEEELDKVLDECETLMVSLKTFKQLSRFLNFNEAVQAQSSSQNIEKKTNNNGLVPLKLIESYQIMDGMLKFTKDFKQFQLYYCELCDDSSYLTNNVKKHLSSEKHTTALLSTSNSFSMHQCKSCGLFIMATQSILKSIIDAEFHFTVDKTFENLKLKSDDINPNVSIKPKENNTQVTKDTEDCSTVTSENSDSLVSESTKKNDEGAEGGINEEKENDICSNNNESNNKIKFYKSKWSMTDIFVEINDKMLNRKITYCHYCILCNQALISAEDWYCHKQSQEHIKNTRGHRNYQEKCFKCPFHIFGRKPALNAYLRYHKDINHKNTDQHGSKDSIINNKKIEKSKERNFNSSWKNSSYFNRKNKIVKDNTKDDQRFSEDISNLEEDESETLLNKTYEVKPNDKHEILVPQKKFTSLSLCHDVIALQKKIYFETNYNPSIGACLLCDDIIKDEYDWIGHVKGVHTTNSNFVEDTCKKCNISIYGPLEVIKNEVWDTEEHHELDKLII